MFDHGDRVVLDSIREALRVVLANQTAILLNQAKTMAAIDDLNAASAKLQTDVSTLIANQPAPGTSDTAIEAVTAQLTALDAQVVAATPAAPAPPAAS